MGRTSVHAFTARTLAEAVAAHRKALCTLASSLKGAVSMRHLSAAHLTRNFGSALNLKLRLLRYMQFTYSLGWILGIITRCSLRHARVEQDKVSRDDLD